jgi:hypothetical protein
MKSLGSELPGGRDNSVYPLTSLIMNVPRAPPTTAAICSSASRSDRVPLLECRFTSGAAGAIMPDEMGVSSLCLKLGKRA